MDWHYTLLCYNTLGWKGLPQTNTLAIGTICKLWRKWRDGVVLTTHYFLCDLQIDSISQGVSSQEWCNIADYCAHSQVMKKMKCCEYNFWAIFTKTKCDQNTSLEIENLVTLSCAIWVWLRCLTDQHEPSQ